MADWLGIDSSNLHSYCGYTSKDLESALDGDGSYWAHYAKEAHWFILDLGGNYSITKVGSFSDMPYDPIDVDIYISTDTEDWGEPVVSSVDQWQDCTPPYVEVGCTEKTGRYIKVVISGTEHDSPGYVQWGYNLQFPIIDVYGELAGGEEAYVPKVIMVD